MFEHVRADYRVYKSLRNRAMWAMLLYRYGRWGAGLRVAPLRWAANRVYGLLRTFSPILTGICMERNMKVGEHFHIIHPDGIIIHPGVEFGDRCGIMHNVTVGTNMNRPGVPRIGNDVFIGAGAVVVGPITIGDGALIAANSLVFFDVPPDALALGVPAVIHPNKSRLRRRAEEPADAVGVALPIGEGPFNQPPAGPAKAA